MSTKLGIPTHRKIVVGDFVQMIGFPETTYRVTCVSADGTIADITNETDKWDTKPRWAPTDKMKAVS